MRKRTGVGIAAATLLALTGCDYESAESVTESTVGRTVEIGRGVGAGLVEGARSGREGTPSTDGATVVSDWEHLAEHGDVEVNQVVSNGRTTVVTLLIDNRGKNPLRVAGLSRAGTLLAIDDDRVAHDALDAPTDLTVHAESRSRVEVRFGLPGREVRSIRVFGHDIDVSPEPPQDTPEQAS